MSAFRHVTTPRGIEVIEGRFLFLCPHCGVRYDFQYIPAAALPGYSAFKCYEDDGCRQLSTIAAYSENHGVRAAVLLRA